MNSMLRWTLGSVALTAAATTFAGCVVTIEPATRWEGTIESETVAYADDDDIRVVSHNGTVTFQQGSADEITVDFQPFSMRADSEEKLAQQDMEDDLELIVEDQGGTVLIEARVADGANGGLGADIVVSLPAGYLGGVEIEQNNGSIDGSLGAGVPAYTTIDSSNGSVSLSGVAGNLAIEIDNGSSDIAVSGWGSSDGHVTLGNGDLTFYVADGLAGRIHAVAGSDGTVTGPSSWEVVEASGYDKTFTFGTDGASAPLVTLTNEFGFGNIAIELD